MNKRDSVDMIELGALQRDHHRIDGDRRGRIQKRQEWIDCREGEAERCERDRVIERQRQTDRQTDRQIDR